MTERQGSQDWAEREVELGNSDKASASPAGSLEPVFPIRGSELAKMDLLALSRLVIRNGRAYFGLGGLLQLRLIYPEAAETRKLSVDALPSI